MTARTASPELGGHLLPNEQQNCRAEARARGEAELAEGCLSRGGDYGSYQLGTRVIKTQDPVFSEKFLFSSSGRGLARMNQRALSSPFCGTSPKPRTPASSGL